MGILPLRIIMIVNLGDTLGNLINKLHWFLTWSRLAHVCLHVCANAEIIY